MATEVNAEDQTASASTDGASTSSSPSRPPNSGPATSTPTGITRASSSCSPLRTSSRASVSACRTTRRDAGAAPGAGVEVECRRHQAARTRVWVRKTLSRDSPDPVSSATVPETGHAARVEDVHLVGQRLRLVHGVGGQHQGHAGGAQLAQQLPGRPAGVRIHPGRGLVQEHQLGATEDRRGQVDRLLLAAGQSAVRRTDDVAQVESLDQRRRWRAAWRTGRRGSAAARRPGCPTRRRCSAASGRPGRPAQVRRGAGRGPGRRRSPAGPARCSSAARWSCRRRSDPAPR